MNLGARLRALERQTREAGISGLCPTCGGPCPGIVSMIVVDKTKPEAERSEAAIAYELKRTCSDCGLLVGPEGKAISEARPTSGNRRIGKVIVLRGKSRGVPR